MTTHLSVVLNCSVWHYLMHTTDAYVNEVECNWTYIQIVIAIFAHKEPDGLSARLSTDPKWACLRHSRVVNGFPEPKF